MGADMIAKGLSEAQKRALSFGHPTPHGNVFCGGGIHTQRALAGKRLVTGHGSVCFLTESGKAVRAILKGEQ